MPQYSTYFPLNIKATISDDGNTYPLAELAGGPKVDDLDCAAFGVAEQDVLWFEITVDDVELRRGQEE